MTSIGNAFLQIAGAIPFSYFIKKKGRKKESKKRSNRKTNRRTTRRSTRRKRRPTIRTDRFIGNNKSIRIVGRSPRLSQRKTTRRKARRTSRRKARRTSRKNVKKSKKLIFTPRKICRKGCEKNVIKNSYKGDEPSPEGLGYCAPCPPSNIVMKGKDGNLWKIIDLRTGKKWVRI